VPGTAEKEGAVGHIDFNILNFITQKNNQKRHIMSKEKMTAEEIEKFNGKVEFNQTAASWIMDIVCAIIAWPMIILAIHRRIKYSKKIVTNNENGENESKNSTKE
jgi:hypothetical protein